jgi:hypothetical protein
MSSEPYFVAAVTQMPGATVEQTGVFYAIPSATSPEDACQQAAVEIIEQGAAGAWFAPNEDGSMPVPWLLAVPASACVSVDLAPTASATGSQTAVPEAPSVSSTSDSAGDVTLAWEPTGPAQKVVYTVMRSSTSGGPYSVVSRSVAPGFTDSKLTAGTYYYVVVASNVNGESPTAEVSVTVA